MPKSKQNNLVLAAGEKIVFGDATEQNTSVTSVSGVLQSQIDTNASDLSTHTGTSSIHFTEGSIDHTNIQNIGSNSHATIDTHIADGTKHYLESSIDHTNIQNIGSNSHTTIDSHISDSTKHFTEGSIDHGSIAGLSGDDHTQYILVDGTRAFTGTVSGVTPTTDAHLVTRSYMTDFYSHRNELINGGFDNWQRATTQSTDGYGSDDRWFNGHSGSTKTHSQQTFTLGQTDVPGNPKYFSRTDVTAGAGAGDYCIKGQRIESVLTLASQTTTLSFYAKVTSGTANIATEFVQNFGTGGSPSSAVTGIGVTTHAVTTSWQKFTTTVSIPSISGKTLGSNGDDYLEIDFWFDSGSTYNSRNNSLGHQTAVFDITNVQLEAGSIATPFEKRHIALENTLCQRYYQTTTMNVEGYNATGAMLKGQTSLRVAMRATPTITDSLIGGANTDNSRLYEKTTNSVAVRDSITSTGSGYFNVTVYLDAEL